MEEINCNEAKKLALALANSNFDVEGDELVIVDEETVTKGYGWYFRFASKRYLVTRDFRDIIVGRGPILITKYGKSVEFGSALPLEEYISNYERGNLID